jgi:hypothetical protein
VREAVIAALKADAGVAAVVGTRVLGRDFASWAAGALSPETTPEAFDADGELAATLVVVLEGRVADDTRRPSDPDHLPGRQVIAVWALARSFAEVKAALRAVKRVLGRGVAARFEAVNDPVRWTATHWTGDSAELTDQALNVPAMVARFNAIIEEDLT